MQFSILIPAYNARETLRRCVESVLANDCSDCEILLVDDGSTDGQTPGLCDALAAGHPGLVRAVHRPNGGVGAARNTCLEEAQGDYLLFIDSDDYVAPNCLARIREEIQKTHADIYSIDCYSNPTGGNFYPQGNTKSFPAEPFTLAEQPTFLLSMLAPWANIWSRELFVRGGLHFPERVWYEDLRTMPKLFALARSIVALPDCLYYYVYQPGSIMRNTNADRNQEILLAFQDLLHWFRSQGLWEQYRDVLCRLCIDHMYLAASVRVLLVDPQHPLLEEFAAYLAREFPDYRQNPYLSQLPRARKLAFHLLERRRYRLLRFLFRMKNR